MEFRQGVNEGRSSDVNEFGEGELEPGPRGLLEMPAPMRLRRRPHLLGDVRRLGRCDAGQGFDAVAIASRSHRTPGGERLDVGAGLGECAGHRPRVLGEGEEQVPGVDVARSGVARDLLGVDNGHRPGLSGESLEHQPLWPRFLWTACRVMPGASATSFQDQPSSRVGDT